MVTTRLPDIYRVPLDTLDPPKAVAAFVGAFDQHRRTPGHVIIPRTYGKGLLLVGPDSDRLVRLAGAVAYACRTVWYVSPDFITVEKWVGLNKFSWDRISNTEGDLLNAASDLASVERSDLLVIDGLGREQASDWTRTEIPALINNRYMRGKPTIATTQLGKAALSAQYNHSEVFDTAFIPVRVGAAEGTRARG